MKWAHLTWELSSVAECLEISLEKKYWTEEAKIWIDSFAQIEVA